MTTNTQQGGIGFSNLPRVEAGEWPPGTVAGTTPSSALGPSSLPLPPPQRRQGHMPRPQGERPWPSESCWTRHTAGWEPGPGGRPRQLVKVCAFGLHPPPSDHTTPLQLGMSLGCPPGCFHLWATPGTPWLGHPPELTPEAKPRPAAPQSPSPSLPS